MYHFRVIWRDLEIWVRAYSRSLEIAPFESLGAVSYSLSIVTILCHFRDKRDIGQKSRFFIPPAFDVPVSELPVGTLSYRLVPKKSDDIFNRFDRIPACDRQTDRQIDGRTSCDSIDRSMHSIEQ